MKKKIIITVIISTIILSGCGNRQIIDTKYTFNKAIIEGIGEIEVKSWSDYNQSDMIQVTDKNGTTYLTHSSNVILMSK